MKISAQNIAIVVEEKAFEGVKRIADTVAGDIELVTGSKPLCIKPEEICKHGVKQIMFCATVGHSSVLEELEQSGKISLDEVKGKREVFCIKLVEKPFDGVEEALVIYGSDKRGTIYGMFTLSEYVGVSPLVFWGDVKPAKKAEVVINRDIEQISKEPSVKYRGFFINDEWPCFGTWVTSHYGDFNAKAYKFVFEFLLRMKGNYMWPAMWSASFPLDGPGSANEELADMYGVVMGYSHHEPCLRASEEWDKVRGPQTKYGNEWNFYTNEEGLLNYWDDALKRSGRYDNLVTIGMRGERDSSMLGEDATVEENVNLLKDIIRKQRQLIAKNNGGNADDKPQLIALYKEVEQYFYGNEELGVAGLKDYDELENVICMLCEDNFGHMRTLPTEDVRNRKGGWGMYYHFDYHGGPISYEWVDSTPLSKTWEQMCMAYEYGIRDVWIVNVGDLKFHEVPLTYFLALAYDYEKWGYGNKDSYNQYINEWVAKTFPQADESLCNDIGKVFKDYININNLRRPESNHEGIYHPCNYGETDRMLERATAVEILSESVMERLSHNEKDAYYSMIHYPAMASMNLLKMHLYSGKNTHYATQGRQIANFYADKLEECIQKDKNFVEEFGHFLDGKWNGMQLASHIGFTKWNEDGYRYPIICRTQAVHRPRMSVSRVDEQDVATKNYFGPSIIKVDDFMYPDCDEVKVEIANDGVGYLKYTIKAKEGEIPSWLELSSTEGEVVAHEYLTIRCNREKLTSDEENVCLIVSDGDTRSAFDIYAKKTDLSQLPEMTFVSSKDAIVMGAEHYCDKKDVENGSFQVIKDYGKYSAGLKVFPSTSAFSEGDDRPEVSYQFLIEEEGIYTVELMVAPTNSVVNKQSVNVMVDNNLGDKTKVELVASDFRAGESSDPRWGMAVLDQIRIKKVDMPFKKGVQRLTIGAMEAGVVLERIRIYKNDSCIKESYLGPEESVCVQR